MKIKELLKYGYESLDSVKIESYKIDSQLILCKVLNKDRLFLFTNMNTEVKKEDEFSFKKYIDKRKTRYPVKYILKSCDFMGINFFIDEGVLIPRPETEILVEEVLKRVAIKKYNVICDVCCGSGVIGLSIAKSMENVRAYLYDISDRALEITRKNIEILNLNKRVTLSKSDLLEKAIHENIKFDAIISNPPYIKDSDISGLMEDVRKFEPYIALSGGEDGLKFYRKIVHQSRETLNENGLLAFEIGDEMAADVSRMLVTNGFYNVCCIKDLSGRDRIILGYKRADS